MPVIPSIMGAEAGGSKVQGQPGLPVLKLCLKKTKQKRHYSLKVTEK
jgi:hypothetical protein